MAKEQTKGKYQLWVWYGTQPADEVQNGWILHTSSDMVEQLYDARVRLAKEDRWIVTRAVTLSVEASL